MCMCTEAIVFCMNCDSQKFRHACRLLQKLHPVRDGLVDILLPQLNITLQCLKRKTDP